MVFCVARQRLVILVADVLRLAGRSGRFFCRVVDVNFRFWTPSISNIVIAQMRVKKICGLFGDLNLGVGD